MKVRMIPRGLALVSAVAAYSALFLHCHRLRATGSRQLLAIILAVLFFNVLYSVLYFANEFRRDHIVSGRLPLAAATKVKRRQRYLAWYWVVLVNVSQLFVFSFLFDYFYRVGGSRHFSYVREISFVDWLLYTIDCTFKSVFDFTEIFDLHLRNIRHHGFMGGVIVATVRLLIYSLLMATLLRQFNKRRLASATVRALDNAPRLAGSQLVRMGEDALPALRRALSRRRCFLPDHEEEALVCNEHSRPVIEILVRYLRAGRDEERLNAAVVLGLLAIQDSSGDPYFRQLVATARDDPLEAVRIECIRSLGRIADPRILPSLRRLRDDPRARVRTEASRALDRWTRAERAA